MTHARTREKRRSPRIATSTGIWVSWQVDEGPRNVSRVRDLSVGGAFVAADTPPLSGTAVKLLFSLPEGELRIDGLVCYSKLRTGMGIEFKRMSAVVNARLQELLRRLKT